MLPALLNKGNRATVVHDRAGPFSILLLLLATPYKWYRTHDLSISCLPWQHHNSRNTSFNLFPGTTGSSHVLSNNFQAWSRRHLSRCPSSRPPPPCLRSPLRRSPTAGAQANRLIRSNWLILFSSTRAPHR